MAPGRPKVVLIRPCRSHALLHASAAVQAMRSHAIEPMASPTIDVAVALFVDDRRSRVRIARFFIGFVVSCLFIVPTRKRLPFNRFPYRRVYRCGARRARDVYAYLPVRGWIRVEPPWSCARRVISLLLPPPPRARLPELVTRTMTDDLVRATVIFSLLLPLPPCTYILHIRI